VMENLVSKHVHQMLKDGGHSPSRWSHSTPLAFEKIHVGDLLACHYVSPNSILILPSDLHGGSFDFHIRIIEEGLNLRSQ
jgi:hypothetical protein